MIPKPLLDTHLSRWDLIGSLAFALVLTIFYGPPFSVSVFLLFFVLLIAIWAYFNRVKAPEKPIVYIDLDGVCADYDDAKDAGCHPADKGFFSGLCLIDGAKDAVIKLAERYDVYFLSTAPWSNVNSWSEKRLWVDENFGTLAFKRLILTHNKGLLKGDYLIDDRTANGVDEFEGTHIHFGTVEYANWADVLEELLPEEAA